MSYTDDSRSKAADVIHNINQHDDQSPWYYKGVVWLMGVFIDCVFTTEEIDSAQQSQEELAKVMLHVIEGDWTKSDPKLPALFKQLFDACDGDITRLDASIDWALLYRLYMGAASKLES